FVVRVAGNVAEPGIIGSIDYAVEHFRTPLIVVLGHDHCGAVEAAVEDKPLRGHLGDLIRQIQLGSARSNDKEAAAAAGVEANVRYQVRSLLRRSDTIKDFVHEKRLEVVGGVYGLKSGRITWLEDPEKKRP